MLPDLRFLIGATLAAALLGVTGVGLFATMQMVHQTRVGPLESSRILAFTADGMHQPGGVARFGTPLLADDPFAGIPRATIVADRLAQESPAAENPADSPPAAESAQPAALPANDHDTVDERAVIEPPLPPGGDDTQTAAEPSPQAPVERDSQAAVAAPAPPLDVAPDVAAPNAGTPNADAASVAAPTAAAAPEPDHVGSLPPAPAEPPVEPAEPIAPAALAPAASIAPADSPAAAAPPAGAASEEPAASPASGEGAAPAPAAEAEPAAKPAAKKAVRRAKARPKLRKVRTVQPTASSGYPIAVSPFPAPALPKGAVPKGLWSNWD
jgi:hypothetical protein